MSLNVFGYNEETLEIIGPLFQSEVEKPLYINMMILEMDITCTLKIFQGKFFYLFLSLLSN